MRSGKKVFWHSSAHVLGEASERHYGCHLCLGPPTDEGFFYEMGIQERCVFLATYVRMYLIYCTHRAVATGDYSALEKICESAVKEKQKFERLVVKKETLLEMFHVYLLILVFWS